MLTHCIASHAALDELLVLLELTDYWRIDELKRQAQKAILDLGLVRLETSQASKNHLLSCTPNECSPLNACLVEVLERADRVGAVQLVNACRQRLREAEDW